MQKMGQVVGAHSPSMSLPLLTRPTSILTLAKNRYWVEYLPFVQERTRVRGKGSS